MTYSRRQFGRLAATSLPMAAAVLAHPKLLFAAGKPDSRFNGVLVGVITPYSYHNMPNDAESLLKYMVADGISGTEIQAPPVEEWAGAPKAPPFGGRGPGGSGAAGARATNGQQVGVERPKPTPEQLAAQKEQRRNHDKVAIVCSDVEV